MVIFTLFNNLLHAFVDLYYNVYWLFESCSSLYPDIGIKLDMICIMRCLWDLQFLPYSEGEQMGNGLGPSNTWTGSTKLTVVASSWKLSAQDGENELKLWKLISFIVELEYRFGPFSSQTFRLLINTCRP